MAADLGSSPLARGTQRLRSPDVSVVGLIPARAGNTMSGLSSKSAVRAHPRSRGEHTLRPSVCVRCRGSSPLARGTLNELRQAITFPGLIPARAGNTRAATSPMPTAWAHPRSRGEHAAKQGGVYGELGSSPLARGTRGHLLTLFHLVGLIPARAGNTGFWYR